MRTIHIVSMVTVLGALFFGATSYAADVAKIGVVDIQKVLENSSAGKAAKAEIKQQFEEMKTALQQKRGEIEELRKQLERDAMVISREKQDEKEREMRIKINDFKSLEKRYTNELKDQEKKIFARLQRDVFTLTEEIGKKDGYLLIVRKIGVLYAPSSIDITDQLIKEYNAKYAQIQSGGAKQKN